MGNSVENVTYGKPKIGGAVFRAPLGTPLPVSASDELNEAFECIGYISDDGLSNDNSPTSSTVKAWGGDTVLAMQTDRPDTFKFKMIEAGNIEVLKVVYGDNNVSVDASGNITIQASTEELTAGAWVVDQVLKGGRAKRIVIPNGTVTQLDTINYKDNEAVGYGTTITAVPDSSGYTHYEYIAGDTTPVYTVTFHTNGGSDIASQKVRSGNGAVQPASPTRDGYVFKGWYADEQLTTVYVFGSPVTENTDVYADWEAE